MSYYDHATAMAFKLGRWSEERTIDNVELEMLACQRRTLANVEKRPSIFSRCVSVFHARRALDETDGSIPGKR